MMDTYARIGCKYVVIPYLTEKNIVQVVKFQEVLMAPAKCLVGSCQQTRHDVLCITITDFEFWSKITDELMRWIVIYKRNTKRTASDRNRYLLG